MLVLRHRASLKQLRGVLLLFLQLPCGSVNEPPRELFQMTSNNAVVKCTPVMWRSWAALVAVVLAAADVRAHDFWIEPGTFSARPGQRIEVRLRVGEHFAGEPVPLLPSIINQFVVQDAVERRPVDETPEFDPAGAVDVARPGLQVIGYFGKPSLIELQADRFNAYLMDEGLESVIAMRLRRGQLDAAAKEAYLRCAKSLVQAGRPDSSAGDRRLGFPLELVAEQNPYALGAGRPLAVRLFFQDAPLAGALVVAMNSLSPSDKQVARTDRNGRVQFSLRSRGIWLVKAVHMIEAPPGTDAEWASYWASLTFGAVAADEGAKTGITG